MLLVFLKRNFMAALLVAIACVSIIYLSKPDRGGIVRCEKIFDLDALSDRGLKMQRLWKWKPFERAKFRMKVDPSRTNDLRKYLVEQGFQEWRRGGIQYGSLNTGWDGSNVVFYSKKQIGKHVQIMAHDTTDNLLYAIDSQ
jgi:hypothetical protein